MNETAGMGEMDDIVCHCFGHTRAAIETDARAHGRSTILAAILAAKREGGCRCAELNPSGR
ncbi:MAG: hypothetical protein HY916_06365 [Desulfovibrio sp.]|jgi:hypothetical protein|nr:hypothetical protein [Desulfovibrio sp.]